jgi:RNA polymerase sigma-70 factor (ECF subfamily)
MKQDDEGAFALIYRRYGERLYATASRVLRSSTDAADVVQDVFLALWNRRRELQITDSLEAYLQTSARYKAIQFIKKNIVRRDYLALLADVAVNTTAGSPELQVQFKEIQRVIHDTVAQMPPKMQEVYLLSRQEQLTHKEIADRLGISTETVKKHIQHALQLIRTAMGYASITLAITLAQQLL